MPVREPIAKEPTADATAPNDRAVIGGNEPPLEERIDMEFREALLSDRPDFMERYNDMLGAAERVVVDDDGQLGKAGDLVNMYRAAMKHIERTHKRVKDPYWQAGRALDAKKSELVGAIDEKASQVQTLMNQYAAKKAAQDRAEREAREAEERRQAEAAAAAQRAREEAEALNQPPEEEPAPPVPVAPTAPAKKEPVRSDAGSTISTKKVWNSRVEDHEIAFMQVSDDEKVREAIEKAVARRVRAGTRKMDGVQIWETAQAVAR